MLLQPLGIFNDTVSVDILREDLRHSLISGNKWWKLKYNLEAARRQGFSTLLTFGGAYSNHLAATAAAAKEQGFKSIGIVRGGEAKENSTLRFCREQGMELRFLSREAYRSKDISAFNFGSCFVIPEGGANELGIKGCAEILNPDTEKYDYILCACGTGATMSGLILGAQPHQKVLGIAVLKGAAFLKEEIRQNLLAFEQQRGNWELLLDYHGGGYGKVSGELLDFIHAFQQKHAVPLDAIYTGKMLLAAMDLLGKGYFPARSKVLLLHSGGLQGNAGILERYGVDLTI